jgi:hypothetical protein
MKRIAALAVYYSLAALIVFGIVLALITSSRARMILGIGLGIVGLFIIACIPHNLRIWRVRKDFKYLPEDVKKRVLELIDEAAESNPQITYLLLNNDPCSDPATAVLSHVGGAPYAEAGETWPAHPNSDPPRFLLQVRIDEPSLGDCWQGRLVVVFLIFDLEQVVRSYAAPSLDKFVPIVPPITPFNCGRLKSLRFPAASEDDLVPMSPAQICDRFTAIKELLSQYSRDPSGLLSQVVCPNHYGYDLQEPDIAYQGGSPMLIQGPHDPECNHCHQRMRFLFQFGEIIPGFKLGDGGVGYVYGCGDHPDHCKAFVDSH